LQLYTYKVLGSGSMDENKLIWMNYGLDETGKFVGRR